MPCLRVFRAPNPGLRRLYAATSFLDWTARETYTLLRMSGADTDVYSSR